MFDREEFINYVGTDSGSTYASGLKSIEKLYGSDINKEYDEDRCASLLALIEADKKSPTLNQTEIHKRQDYASHLKKYIEYKGHTQEEKQQQRFIRWMSEQPQREDSTKKYASETVLAAVAKLKSGLPSLNIAEYQINCFSVMDAQTFLNLYSACYPAAEALDKKQGHRDFRNGLDFYMKFLQAESGRQAYTPNNDTVLSERIERVIAAYKADFARIDKDERYKWEAIGWYKQHWNINAEHFAEMLTDAFSKMFNLLASGMYYPYKMLTQYAAQEPETVRALFRMLYDETVPLAKRYVNFRSGFDNYVKPLSLSHYQDLHAISVYLSCEYPETYYIYKFKVYKGFKKLIGFPEEKNKNESEVHKIEDNNYICNAVLSLLTRDKELLKMSSDRLNETCYRDEAFHLLAMDVVYFGSKLDEPLKEDNEKSDTDLSDKISVTDVDINTILYGPPGTGKTYYTVIYAVAIIENKPLSVVEQEEYSHLLKRYNTYKSQGRIEFTTFHQSYGYEEFIEGIRPLIATETAESDDLGEILYSIQPGLFKRFCDAADHGEPSFDEAWSRLVEEAQRRVGKYVFARKTGTEIAAELRDNETFVVKWNGETQSSNPLKKENIYKQWCDESPDAREGLSGGSRWLFDANQAVIEALQSRFGLGCKNTTVDETQEKKNYVFIIDEINRGNISKIFGELITLIEPSKRLGQPEGMSVMLPYSQKPFGVPGNVYLIGTMNTADRSIAAIDTALRRRFFFREMPPNPDILTDVHVEDISVRDMLIRMNRRLSILYDREHTIGHTYFLPLKADASIESLGHIFCSNILPLLQEYFYEDYEKIALVLGDNKKENNVERFIIAATNNYAELFGKTDFDFDEVSSYEINLGAFDNLDAYRSI